MYKRIINILFIAAVTANMVSCKKFVTVDPPLTEIVTEAVYSNEASAKAVVKGIFSAMVTDGAFTNGYMDLYAGLSADELDTYQSGGGDLPFYTNTIDAKNGEVYNKFWLPAYKYISNANALLEGLPNSSNITVAGKKQLEGEAKFIRAFCYFYLVNLFGDVPYISTTDYKVNATAKRDDTAIVYDHITQDLIDARELLPVDFAFSFYERIEPNRGAATALLARVYLYRKDWANAAAMATELINNQTDYNIEPNLESVFLANSIETIWQLQPVTPEHSTAQAKFFLIQPPNVVRAIPDLVYNDFANNDLRKTSWIGIYNGPATDYYYSTKYKVYSAPDYPIEYATVLRLAEQYLIRAEAYAQQENITEAIADIDVIRNRAQTDLIADTDPGISKENLLMAIEEERKKEFLCEWGHRWLDLKRTGRATAVLSPIKTNWQSTDQLYPIPDQERIANPNLTQNENY